MQFSAKASTLRGRPNSISLRTVWDISGAELSVNAVSALDRLEASVEPMQTLFRDVCWQGQALLEFQDLQDWSLLKSGPFLLNIGFLFCESLNVLRQVILCGLNGVIHAALATLRSSLEAFVFHYWWRRKLAGSDDYTRFYEWVFGSKEQNRNFSRVIDDILNDLEHPPQAFVFNELKAVYSQLCSYAHKALLDEAIITVRGSNTTQPSEKELLFWLSLVQRTQRCMIDVAVLTSPNALFPVDVYRKFGFNFPFGVFMDLSGGYVVEKALGQSFPAYRAHFERLDPPATQMAWFSGLPDLTDEQILATWTDEAPADKPNYSLEDKIAVRACMLKAKMRAMLWSFAYYKIDPADMPELERRISEGAGRDATVADKRAGTDSGMRISSWVTAPDNMEGIENREVYALAGAALYQAQCLEHEIVNSLGLAAILPYWTTKRRSKSRAEYEAHVDRIWDENYERTLGQLLRSLRQSGFAIPTTLDSLLRESLEKRNYLVHSYFRERAKDWFTPEGRRSMAAELKSMQELFRKADHALHDVTSKMYSAIGVTEEKVTAIADLMLADANDEEIDKVLSKK
jgi:hypothetical protein